MAFKIQKVLFATVIMLSFVSVSMAETCLTYNSVGDSECQGGLNNVEEIPLVEDVTPTVEVPVVVKEAPKPAKPAKPTLDDRIDRYMDEYNKPPREFVAFNLEPTLENALKWAKKYREIRERNKKLTAAWGQAQTILSDMESNGQEIEGYEAMPEIPDYGATLPKGFKSFAGEVPSQQVDYQGIAQNSATRNGAPTLGFSENGLFSNQDSNAQSNSGINTGSKALQGESITAPAREGPIEISYYFSAECPFCAKFEAGFKGLIKDMGSDLNVVCVDMTPSKRDRSNVFGKIDCSWRAAVPGEARAMGINSTPTLLVDRRIGKGLEKIEGVADIGKLKSFLLGGV